MNPHKMQGFMFLPVYDTLGNPPMAEINLLFSMSCCLSLRLARNVMRISTRTSFSMPVNRVSQPWKPPI